MVSRVFSINTKCQIPVWRIEKIGILKEVKNYAKER